MAEPKKETKKEVEEILVVAELPTIQTRVVENEEDGKKYRLVTTNEALTEILTTIREIKKGVAG